MSNSQRAAKPLIPSGDFGLGLCVQCLGDVIIDPDNAAQPQFAITLAPLPQPGGVVPAPACFEHLKQSVLGQQAPPPPARPRARRTLIATAGISQ